MIVSLFRSKLRQTALMLLCTVISLQLKGQISPGDLSEAHASLEGISNCTKCHEIGKRISPGKCLSCHSEINDRIKAGKGFHSSSVVKEKQCIECHNEHHGKKFRLIQFDTGTFDHNLTGYRLSDAHSRVECSECHKPSLIKNPEIRKKNYTWLGAGTACLDCHEDYHLSTLPSSCLDCHSEDSFETVPGFNHDNSRFRLTGKHKTVDCEECHKTETVNGKPFVEFRGVPFGSCTDCHTDPHNNKFGSDCRKCHTESSFSDVKNLKGFNHNTTNFPLEGKHVSVECRLCHRSGLTATLKHENCTDCHADFHKGEFMSENVTRDCAECHSTEGFQHTSFTLVKHDRSVFPLKGAHLSVPCTECHRKNEDWSFRKIGSECRDCHSNIHSNFIDPKYFPGENCMKCHTEETWNSVRFDHSQTSFILTGRHADAACAGCHITRSSGQLVSQQFRGLPVECSSCHQTPHEDQFPAGTCTSCHNTNGWEPRDFDHNKTAFRLEGGHADVPCADCHKPVLKESKKFTLYKIGDFRCESCHL